MSKPKINLDELTISLNDISLNTDSIPFAPQGEALGTESVEAADPGPMPELEEMERIAQEEVNEIFRKITEAGNKAKKKFIEDNDGEYWVALCFQTRAQKEEFLQKVGWMHLGDKYIDGMELAELLGISLESEVPPLPRERIDPTYRSLAL